MSDADTKPRTQCGVIALIVAGGNSRRMQADLPKPYMELAGETLLRRCVRTFLNHPGIDGVRVVIRREHHTRYKHAVKGLTLFPCVVGGDTRQESVCRGLESIAHRHPERVLVHDAARPLASPELITRVLKGLDTHPGAIPALRVIDTVKRMENGLIGETLDREKLVTVQTPQGFHFKPLYEAHLRFRGQSLTDDAALLEKTGHPIIMVEGDAQNQKITHPKDLEAMHTILNLNSETRTGMGFDVHQLKAHDIDTPASSHYIKICGIKIPFTHYLVGHSDADVGLHALVDAILGAIGAGDIGIHFSPDDRKWQGADSERFLLYAYELLTAKGGELVHMDITIICERPKISAYRSQMIEHISQLLKLPAGRISIKATTTEKLGFTGRGEGVAAQAIATVRVPRV